MKAPHSLVSVGLEVLRPTELQLKLPVQVILSVLRVTEVSRQLIEPLHLLEGDLNPPPAGPRDQPRHLIASK